MAPHDPGTHHPLLSIWNADDLDMAPFDGRGGLGQMYKLFGDGMDSVIDELNEALAG